MLNKESLSHLFKVFRQAFNHIVYIDLSLVRILELWSVGGGNLLTMLYFRLSQRQCADRIIFPVGGMLGCPCEFLSPSLGD